MKNDNAAAKVKSFKEMTTVKAESYEDIRKANEAKRKELNDWNRGFIRKDLDVNEKDLKIFYGPNDDSYYWN